tara:strand:- start:400 stop:642 length:243 start_codon:yes stop_codon:yes gene_type:complete
MRNRKQKKEEKEFKPHTMFNPKTGEGFAANTLQDHNDMKKMGYVHKKPKAKKKNAMGRPPAKKKMADRVSSRKSSKSSGY